MGWGGVGFGWGLGRFNGDLQITPPSFHLEDVGQTHLSKYSDNCEALHAISSGILLDLLLSEMTGTPLKFLRALGGVEVNRRCSVECVGVECQFDRTPARRRKTKHYAPF